MNMNFDSRQSWWGSSDEGHQVGGVHLMKVTKVGGVHLMKVTSF